MSITPEEIEKIKEQETTRLQLRKALAPEKSRGIWGILNSQFALWLLGSVVLSGVTYYWNYQSNQRVAHEKRLQEDSQFLLQLLPSITNADRNVRLRAIDVIKTRYPEDTIPIAVQRLITNIVSEATSGTDSQQPEETKRLIANAVETLDKLSQPDPTVTAAIQQLPPRVYIQIFSNEQREKAKKIQSDLNKLGFIVPGIENVQSKVEPLSNTEVRYYYDTDTTTANDVSKILIDNGIPNPKVTPTNVDKKPKSGTIEVWISTKG